MNNKETQPIENKETQRENTINQGCVTLFLREHNNILENCSLALASKDLKQKVNKTQFLVQSNLYQLSLKEISS